MRGTPHLVLGGLRDRKSTRLNSSHTVISPLSLRAPLPILKTLNGYRASGFSFGVHVNRREPNERHPSFGSRRFTRSEEHTSELQSHSDLPSFPTRPTSDLKDSERLPGQRILLRGARKPPRTK